MIYDPTFLHYIKEVIIKEGGFVDDPDDSGGATKCGITEALARQYGYKGHMKDLPEDMILKIYYFEFWLKMKLDQIVNISPATAREMLDTGINQGGGQAVKYLQLALNAFNDRQKHYADIKADGVMGPATLAAFRQYISKRGGTAESVMYKALNALQGAYYINISQQPHNGNKNEKYVFGWFDNRVQ